MLLFLLARCLDERPQCFRAGRAVSARQRETRKTSFLTSFSHIFHWLRGHTREKKGKTPALLSGAVSMKRRSAFIFPVLPPVLFTERRKQQWASWLNASHLSSPPHTLLAWERSAVWNGPEGHWSVLAYGQVVLFFIRVTFQDHFRWEEPSRFLFSEGISHALDKSAFTKYSWELFGSALQATCKNYDFLFLKHVSLGIFITIDFWMYLLFL